MRRGVWALLLVAVLAVGLVIWSPWKTEIKSTPSELIPVRVAQTGDFLLYAGLYVGIDSGAFEKRGLKVSVTNTGGDEKSAAAVLSGSADIGIGDPTFAAIAKAKGQDLRVISALVAGAPFWGITYKEDVAKRYAATGLRGLRVATFPSPSTAYTLQTAMFKKAGLPSTIVPGAFGSLQGILETGKADVALEIEPNVSLAQSRGGKVLYSMSSLDGNLAITGAVVSGAFATKNPAVVRSFCGGLADSYAYMRTHPDETVALLAKRFKELPLPVITAALKRMLAEGIIPQSPRTDAKAWRAALDLRVAVGDIADAGAVESALDNSFCQ